MYLFLKYSAGYSHLYLIKLLKDMMYDVRIAGDYTFAYIDNKLIATFLTDVFLMDVISPKEFKAFERNPLKRKFHIRKLELNNLKIK